VTQLGLRVIKLGGSLLDFAGLPAALDRWLAEQPRATNLVIVGGGRLADQIRACDRRFHLGDDAAHRLAIRAMSVNAHLLAELIEAAIVTCLDEVKSAVGALLILDPVRLLLDDEPSLPGSLLPGPPLPRNWNATSDSIAAQVARLWKADELVLLKSALPRDCRDWESAAALGFVDAHFPQIAAGLPAVRCVNLRDPHMPQWRSADSDGV
jgi:aspartokinase-like uncharacterized kinase